MNVDSSSVCTMHMFMDFNFDLFYPSLNMIFI